MTNNIDFVSSQSLGEILINMPLSLSHLPQNMYSSVSQERPVEGGLQQYTEMILAVLHTHSDVSPPMKVFAYFKESTAHFMCFNLHIS